ncbi:MAG: hypothetical protein QNJ38_18810 [Prochloraceae cyanobacterium]|nr:hypothetical protein [Prochloraceae cyanobacterium]
MGRPRKYDDPFGAQKAYFKTPKGKAALKKAQSSENGKRIKLNWWQKNRGTAPSDRANKFIDTYGDVEKALSLLDEREQEVIVKIYGLDGNLPIKQKDIAKQWGTSGQWITEVKQSAIAKLEAAKQAKAEATEQDKNPSAPEAQREES